uniref:Ig-like domain-containing protein n=1 Tax=Panagrolaimus sp. ES5 TaxID=591445 RepID=A0AC34F8P8_9BILA
MNDKLEHVVNGNKHYLIIHNAQPDDSGVYSVAINDTQFKVAQITITEGSQILSGSRLKRINKSETPDEAVVPVGTNVTIKCETATSKQEIEWQKDHASIPPNERYSSDSDAEYRQHYLTIKNVEIDDTGNFGIVVDETYLPVTRMIVVPDDNVMSDSTNIQSSFDTVSRHDGDKTDKTEDWEMLEVDDKGDGGKSQSTEPGSIVDLNVNIVNQPEQETLLFTKNVAQAFEIPPEAESESDQQQQQQPRKERRASEQTIEKEHSVQVKLAKEKGSQHYSEEKSIPAVVADEPKQQSPEEDIEIIQPSPPQEQQQLLSPEQQQVLEEAQQEQQPPSDAIPGIDVASLDVINRFAEEFAYSAVQEALFTPFRDEFILIEPAEAPPPSEDFDDTSDITTDIEMISMDFAAEVTQTADADLIFVKQTDNQQTELLVLQPRISRLKAIIEFHKDGEPVTHTEDINCRFTFSNAVEAAEINTTIQENVQDEEISADENSLATASSESTAYSPPVFILSLPESETLQALKPKVFRCTFHGIPLPYATWHINDVTLQNSSNFNIINEDGVTLLQIKEVPKSWKGKDLRCEIRNPAGHAMCSCLISIDDSEERMEVVSINSIEEYKEIEAIVTSKQKVSLTLDKESGNVTVGAEAAAEAEEDENTISISSTDTQTISGRHPKFVKELPHDLYVKEDEKVQLKCNFSGYPYPQIRWLKNGNIMSANRYYNFISEDGIALLSLQKPQLDDNAIFTCEAVNAIGTARTHCVLNIEEEDAFESQVRLDIFCHKELSDTTLDVTVIEQQKIQEKLQNLKQKDESDIEDDSQKTLTDTTPTTSEYDEDEYDNYDKKAYREKPTFNNTLKDQTIVSRSNIRLKTFVSGKPEPEITWTVEPKENVENYDKATTVALPDKTKISAEAAQSAPQNLQQKIVETTTLGESVTRKDDEKLTKSEEKQPAESTPLPETKATEKLVTDSATSKESEVMEKVDETKQQLEKPNLDVAIKEPSADEKTTTTTTDLLFEKPHIYQGLEVEIYAEELEDVESKVSGKMQKDEKSVPEDNTKEAAEAKVADATIDAAQTIADLTEATSVKSKSEVQETTTAFKEQ